MNIKVTCIPTDTGGTGLDVYSEGLLTHLYAEDIDITIQRDKGKEFSLFGQTFGGYISRFAWNLLGNIEGTPDIVHSFDLLNLHKESNILTIHDTYAFDYPNQYNIGNTLWKLWMKRAENLDALIANSHYTKSRTLHHLDIEPDKIHVTHLAPFPIFRPLSRRSFEESFHVLMVGDFKPRKNNLETVLSLQKLEGSVVLHHAGPKPEGRYGEIVSAYIQDSDYDYHEHGYIDIESLVKLYNFVDVLAFPSIDEGFGLPVLEAAACGTPSVVSEHPVFEETIGNMGIRKENLIEAFRIARDEPPPPEDLIEQASKFSWTKTARQTANVYEKVARA